MSQFLWSFSLEPVLISWYSQVLPKWYVRGGVGKLLMVYDATMILLDYLLLLGIHMTYQYVLKII